jgi:tripartite-type tricarboxylate transporter receptor subunit TctC
MSNQADAAGCGGRAAMIDRPTQGAAPGPALRTRRTLAMGLLLATAPAVLRGRPTAAAAANWPNRPIRLVVGFGPGGAGDLTARLLAPKLAENSTATAPALYNRLPFDPARDFALVSRVSFFDHVIAVSPDLPVRSLAELAAFARADPGRLNIGSISVGNATHLGAALLRTMLGAADATLVTYRGTPELLNAAATGEVQVASEILPPALPQIAAGRIRAIAIAAPERFARLPEVPTAAESGLPGYVVRSWNGVAVPARTPRPIVERLNAELVRILALPDVRERLLALGVTPSATTPEAFRDFFAEEAARWARVIADAGIERQ